MLWTLAVPAHADELLGRAEVLLNSERPRDALALLAPAEASRAGEPAYDYLLGVATLDAGDPGKAALVFERVLAVRPQFHGARLDYARALYASGRIDEAEAQFRRVAASNPPVAASAAIADYLARIDKRNRRLQFSRYIEVRTRAGYDSNVNSATDVGEFLGFTLNETSRESDSDFIEFGVAAGGGWRPRDGLTLDSRLSYTTRRNGQTSFADTDVLLGSLRLRADTLTQRRSVAVRGFALDIDGEENNSAFSFDGHWSWRVGDSWWVGGGLRYTPVRYGDALAVKDIDQLVLSASAQRAFGAMERGSLRLRVGYGEDDPKEAASRYARDVILAGASVSWRFTPQLSAAVSASVEDSDYDAIFFEQRYDSARSDTTWRGRGVIDWRFARRWRFNHTLSYVRNDTEVEIFEFERFEFGVGLSYEWR